MNLTLLKINLNLKKEPIHLHSQGFQDLKELIQDESFEPLSNLLPCPATEMSQC